MALPLTIEIGDIDLSLLSSTKERAEYREENMSIPPMFRRTLTLSAKPNSTGTNVNVAFKLVTPIITIENGVSVAKNRRVLSGSYTSLQNVLDATNGKDISDIAAALTALKPHFVNGSLA